MHIPTYSFLFFTFLACCLHGSSASIRRFHWTIDYANYTVLCKTKALAAVNGKSPGPILHVQKGDRVIIKVTNLIKSNVTIHWHGVKQRQSVWSDGPAMITQCPIQTGQTFTYNYTIPDQEGTLFWHAHISWLRGTIYGAIVIDPPPTSNGKSPFPFPKPDGEHVLVLGEWWNADIEEVESEASRNGLATNLSDAYLINGYTGFKYNLSKWDNCNVSEAAIVKVQRHKKYLLRVVNNALETDLFLTVANHSLTVVETDAGYTKKVRNNTFLISPGQTYNFLITADQPIGQYYIVASPFERSSVSGVQEYPATAILRYAGADSATEPIYPSSLPAKNDSSYFENSQNSIRSLNSKRHKVDVPKNVDVDLYYVISLNLEPCTVSNTSNCLGPGVTSFASSINNLTFVDPSIPILQAYFYNTSGVYTTDFPSKPKTSYNYSSSLSFSSLASESGTKVTIIPYGSNVQLVFQGTENLQAEAHPMHLHGFDFFVVGSGKGNYNSSTDPKNFNLRDPAQRNTVMLTRSGWTAIRWKADNPGVWLMHCHFDGHVSWGMVAVFIVTNGAHPNETLPSPPKGFPKC